MSEWLAAVATFLGGGIIGALIQHISAARGERKKRHSSYVQEQLEQLYGPLYFLSGQNEQLFELSRRILDAHAEHFDGKRWSTDSRTQQTLREESAETIELSNGYANKVVENNEAIVALLQRAYAFADIDDVEVFTQFTIDALRMNEEVKAERLKRIPLNIYRAVGEISYSRPEFLGRVKQQFEAKQRLLKGYH